MKLLHIILVLGLFGGNTLATVSQNDIPKNVIDKSNANGKEDNEIGEEDVEEETTGNCRDGTSNDEEMSEEEIDKEIEAYYKMVMAHDQFEKDEKKAAMDAPLFAPPRDENETDEDETETDEDTPTGRLDDDTVSNSGGVCRDEKPSEYCRKKANTGQCKHKKIRDECKQACLVCCADRTLCQDKKHLCEHPNMQMRFYCPKTCGFCGEAIKPPACLYTKFGCCWDRKTTKIKFRAAGGKDLSDKWASDNCSKCVDSFDHLCGQFHADCRNFKKSFKGGWYMRKHCPESCRVCIGADGRAPLCMDDPVHEFFCPQYKNKGFCSTNQKEMKFLCSKTCNFCKPCENRPDVANMCDHWDRHKACQRNTRQMKVLCPFTCRFC